MDTPIIARIRKLLSLAANNPNVNEAASAAAKAQRLMLEYQLSDACLVDGPAPVEQQDVTPDSGKRRACVWKATLAHALGKQMCVSVYYTSGTDRIAAIGRGPDVAALCLLFHHLVPQLEAACAQAWAGANRGLQRLNGGRPRFTDTFMAGARSTVVERMIDMKKQVAQDADRVLGAHGTANQSIGSALVRMDSYAAEANAAIARWKAQEGLKVLTTSRSVRSAGDGAYEAGQEAGRRASLTANARSLTSGR
jgi:hypothetical protein